jgi:hypothetical protein
VLRETTSRGLCGLGCPSRTSERGGEGDCVKEGGVQEGKCCEECVCLLLQDLKTVYAPRKFVYGARVAERGGQRVSVEGVDEKRRGRGGRGAGYRLTLCVLGSRAGRQTSVVGLPGKHTCSCHFTRV